MLQIYVNSSIHLSKHIHLNNCDLFSDKVQIHRGMNSATTRIRRKTEKAFLRVVWIYLGYIYMLWTLHNFSLYRLYIIIIPYFAQNIFQTKKHTNGLLFYIIWGKGEKIKRNLGVYRENIEKCSTTIYIQIVDRYFMQCICKAISFYLSDAKNSCLWLFRVNGGIRQMRYN